MPTLLQYYGPSLIQNQMFDLEDLIMLQKFTRTYFLDVAYGISLLQG